MSTPDVRIRLSAEGVAEVVAALHKVQAEAQATAGKTSKGFGLLNGTLGSLKGALGGIAGLLTVNALAGFAASGRQVADQMGNAAQRIGTTTERISALAAVANKSDADITKLQFSLGLFARKLVELRSSEPAATAAFAKLGLAAKDFKGEDTAEAVALVAEKMSPLRASAEKTALALELFGRSGATLIPFLNELGEKGLQKTIDAARELGLVLDDETARAADELGDDFDRLKLQAQLLAAQFVGGLTPDLRRSIAEISGDLSHSAADFKAWGEGVGGVLRGLILVFGTLLDVVITLFDEISTGAATTLIALTSLYKTAAALTTGHLNRAKAEWQAGAKAIEAALDAAARRLDARIKLVARRWDQVTAPDGAPAGGRSPNDEGPDPDTVDALARQRLDIQRAALDAEIALEKAKNKLRLEADQQAFDRGLLDVRAFYARRREIAEAETKAEIASLLRQRALVSAEPDALKRKQEEQRIDAAISQARLAGQQTSLELTDAERKAVRALGDDRVKLAKRVLELEGKRHEAALLDIDEEMRTASELLGRQGAGPEERRQTLQRLNNALQANAAFEGARQEAQDALAELDTARAEIEAKVRAGQLGQFAGEQAILQLERDRLDTLRALAEEFSAFAEGTGDDEKIRQAREFSAAITGLGVDLNTASAKLARFGENARAAITDDLTDWFATAGDDAQNFGDAMRSLALSVVQSLRRIAAEVLATAAVAKLSRIFGFLGSFSLGGGGGSGTEVSGALPLAASGGFIQGPGTGTSDSIPARLSAGEFVVRAAAVRQPGMLDHLSTINAGIGPIRLRRSGGSHRYADGGLVSPAAATGARDGHLLIGLEPGLLLRELETPAGQRVIVKSIAKNRRAVRGITG